MTRPLAQIRLGARAYGRHDTIATTHTHQAKTSAFHSHGRLLESHGPSPDRRDDDWNAPEPHHKPERLTAQRLLRTGRLVLGNKLRELGRSIDQNVLRRVFRRTPIHYSLWTLYAIVVGAGVWYVFSTKRTVNKELSVYPEPIAEHLRSALFYGTYADLRKQNQALALREYRAALAACAEHGLDPLSDEVLGIKLRIGDWMMSIEQYEKAVATLETTLGDCLRGVAEMDGVLATQESRSLSLSLSLSLSQAARAPAVTENPWHRRRRLLHKAIQICLSLGSICSDDHVLQPQKAQASVMWAFQAAMQELLRRRSEGVKEGEGDWMTADEVGALLEQLGHQHEQKSQFHVAVPLFYRAQEICSDPCHRAILMNNLAASFSQHPGHAPFSLLPEAFSSTLPAPGSQDQARSEPLSSAAAFQLPETRAEFLETAQRWAANAYVQGSGVRGEQRTGECDEACAAALCNMGDILAMMGKQEQARAKFQAARNFSLKKGVRGTAQLASRRLKELDAKA